jgi:hypothetical protein
LVYSIVAANGPTGNASSLDPSYIYLSNPGNSATITATAPSATSGNAGQIAPLYLESGGTAVGTGAYNVTESSTAGDTYASVITDYNNQHGGGPYASDYGFTVFNTEQVVSTSGSSINLYLQTPSTTRPTVAATSTDEGTFTLGGNGSLNFTAEGSETAVPEPSTYALFGLGALVLVMMRRRSIKA